MYTSYETLRSTESFYSALLLLSNLETRLCSGSSSKAVRIERCKQRNKFSANPAIDSKKADLLIALKQDEWAYDTCQRKSGTGISSCCFTYSIQNTVLAEIERFMANRLYKYPELAASVNALSILQCSYLGMVRRCVLSFISSRNVSFVEVSMSGHSYFMASVGGGPICVHLKPIRFSAMGNF